jgi:hypothetical protein
VTITTTLCGPHLVILRLNQISFQTLPLSTPSSRLVILVIYNLYTGSTTNESTFAISPLLGLSLELRGRIYEYYVLEEDKYHIYFSTENLITVRMQFINLALTISCRQIAEEMKSVALSNNTIVSILRMRIRNAPF